MKNFKYYLKMIRRVPLLVAAGVIVAGLTGHAKAQTHAAYPLKPVRLIVGFSAGGPTDVVARAFADYATRALGQPFVVDNKPGANSILAADAVAASVADGYTLLLGATNHTMIPALYSARVKFDAVKSFQPICTLAASPTVLVVGPAMPAKTLDGFLAQVKSQPGKRTYATPGAGSSGHFASEQFTRLTGLSMNHIPYKGAAPAVIDLIGGQVDSSFATLGSVMTQVQAGKLTALAVSSSQRTPLLPGVPTFAEAGVKGYAADAWYGLLAPANTPAATVAALQRVASDFARAPATLEKMNSLGMDAQSLCGAPFTAQMEREVSSYSQLARELNLKTE
jgi:tripartite-type tricarboxylate transporter receptor subunit TctC